LAAGGCASIAWAAPVEIGPTSARTEGGRRIANARLRLGSTRAGLGKRGSRRLCLRFRKAGVRKLTASASGYRTARVKIRVLRARR